jgi:hypothetical protein
MNDVSIYTGRKQKLPLAYVEKKSKRHVAHVVDKVKDKIEQAHHNKSMSPIRGALEVPRRVSLRNIGRK